ncbi:Peptidoglycan-binding (PGRP) domain of peptidoglycan hydrolases-containing protein [Abditibacterium utsteinense]|uniref:Peptidoglycan-binding (PGRP) domain of peptidoglycan hydrolases-containing protein n=1 Tax=Abditibacterium utsteinense TaxID=1960156 RepID=A0A2S8STA9_9BACT|nr:peptidoglycan-binding protein [Abditibacterium utsteinense]PQV64018.1 Peptidoglycan-binding (PGRP) domain of peptidoglycan hydrolases-containing protein [Abditibacterium utsteinense]
MKKLILLAVLVSASAPIWSAPRTTLRKAPFNPKTAPVKWPTIRAGDDYAPRVAPIQYLLRGRGFYKGPIDGVFGAKTLAAVKAFQRKNKLKADGVLGARTLPKLVQVVKRGSHGDAVRAAQILARNAMGHNGELPYAALEADGFFGATTEKAVKWAQATRNQFEDRLAENGVMTPRSWCLMLGGEVIGSQV